jgi:hypothetical protein
MYSKTNNEWHNKIKVRIHGKIFEIYLLSLGPLFNNILTITTKFFEK